MSETVSFVHRMNLQLSSRGYCYFAIDKLEDGHFIGFTGLSYQDYYAPFTPCIDIGWRLSKNEWGKGYATEAAKRVIKHGFQDLGIESIVSIAPVINTRSIRVMQNAGMQKTSEFIHPKLITDDRLKRCVLYQITIDMLK